MAMKMISANVMQRENGKRASKNLMNANASGWTRMQLDKHLLAKGNPKNVDSRGWTQMQLDKHLLAKGNPKNVDSRGWTQMQLKKHLLANENHHFSDIADSRQIPFIMLHRERLRAAQMMLNQRLPTMPGGMQPR
jgi:DNA-binding phage protein